MAYFVTKTAPIFEHVFTSAMDKKEEDEVDVDEEEIPDISAFMKIVHILNAAAVIYSFIFFVMLVCFALSMHH